MKNYNPTTPSRRQMSGAGYPKTGSKPIKSLLFRLPNKAGRNFQGRITTRHQGGGHKQLYRLVDFKMDKIGVRGKVEGLEYDPYRSGIIARILYEDGERRYILAPQGLKEGAKIISAEDAPLETGNRTVLKRIPVGSFVYNIELGAKRGGQLVRSAGLGAQILANGNGYTEIKLPSGEIRRVGWLNYGSIGSVSNPEHSLVVIGKAGRSRWLNRRPTVRGKVMNPRDHPYGGGEGKTKRGTRRPKTKWGKVTGGRKTRKRRKWSNGMIIKRRS